MPRPSLSRLVPPDTLARERRRAPRPLAIHLALPLPAIAMNRRLAVLLELGVVLLLLLEEGEAGLLVLLVGWMGGEGVFSQAVRGRVGREERPGRSER